MQPTAVLDRPTASSPADDDLWVAQPATRVAARERARLLVAVDGSTASTRQLVWALQEAARRDATVLAVGLVDGDFDDDACTAARTLLDAQLLHAIAQTGIRDRARATLLDSAVYEALTGTAGGADLVLVGPHHKTVLRPAARRLPIRRPLVRCA